MASNDRAIPTVYVVTAHGRQQLGGNGDERLYDVLVRHEVPWSAVAIYAVPRSGGEPGLASLLDARLDTLTDVAEILLYFNRNVNPFLCSIGGFRTVPAGGDDMQATEYFYQKLDNDRSVSEVYLKKLTPEECRAIIAQRVADVIRTHVRPGSDLVVGVSGGGDSNALLHGLAQLRDHHVNVSPVILMGIPDWDQGVPRAKRLCEQYGLTLTIIEEQEVQSLLGIEEHSVPLIERFEREFKGDDFEFLGTLLIRLALSRRARELGTPYICTGLNLEDIVCEGIFRISSGMKPAACPTRTIGDVTLVMPLWLCPKRIIDGCFPKESLDNYEARYPCFSLGRNLYYSVVYAMQSRFPSFIEQLARGLAATGESDPVAYTYDEQLGFHVERFVPFALRQKFQRMIGAAAAG